MMEPPYPWGVLGGAWASRGRDNTAIARFRYSCPPPHLLTFYGGLVGMVTGMHSCGGLAVRSLE